MREILFRGKRIDTKEWVYGYYMNGAFPFNKGLQRQSYILTGSMKNFNGLWVLEKVRIIPETVGQYTGVEDKEGKKIFEGDLVTFHTEYEMDNDDVWYEKEPYLVKWDNEIAGFEPFYLNGRWRCDIVNLKIVGNKWDNPELLEE